MTRKLGNLEIGSKVNLLTIIGKIPMGKKQELHWVCSCDCGSGKLAYIRNAPLLKGVVKSCGCLIAAHRNISGLSSGWPAKCANCGGEFHATSSKQNACSLECRFDLYSNKSADDECWDWSGPINNQGYGVLFINQNKEEGKRNVTSAHRYSYLVNKGAIQSGMCVMHTCDNRKCTNPKHLVLGTWDDNNKDRSAKGRSGKRGWTESEKVALADKFRGELNHSAKLTEEEARAIKYCETMGCMKLAKLYGVSTATVKAIRRGRSWKHV